MSVILCNITLLLLPPRGRVDFPIPFFDSGLGLWLVLANTKHQNETVWLPRLGLKKPCSFQFHPLGILRPLYCLLVLELRDMCSKGLTQKIRVLKSYILQSNGWPPPWLLRNNLWALGMPCLRVRVFLCAWGFGPCVSLTFGELRSG